MHLPEAALPRGGLGGAGDDGRAGVGALVGEVPEDIDEPLAQGLAQPGEHEAQGDGNRGSDSRHRRRR